MIDSLIFKFILALTLFLTCQTHEMFNDTSVSTTSAGAIQCHRQVALSTAVTNISRYSVWAPLRDETPTSSRALGWIRQVWREEAFRSQPEQAMLICCLPPTSSITSLNHSGVLNWHQNCCAVLEFSPLAEVFKSLASLYATQHQGLCVWTRSSAFRLCCRYNYWVLRQPSLSH